MMYSKKARLDRRSVIMMAVKKELKAHNAFVPPESLRALANHLDTSCFYGIEVIKEAGVAGERLRLRDHKMEHSWAGGEGFEETASVVFGEVAFGEDYSYEYFDNGNSDGGDDHQNDGEFDVNKPFIILIHSHNWVDWSQNSGNHDDEANTIVVYSPETIIDEAEYTAQKDMELTALCDLRGN